MGLVSSQINISHVQGGNRGQLAKIRKTLLTVGEVKHLRLGSEGLHIPLLGLQTHTATTSPRFGGG